MTQTTPTDTRAAAEHPLDPLTEEEVRRAAAVLRSDEGVGPGWRFGTIELAEPSKRVVLDFAPGDPVEGMVLHTIGYEDRGHVRPVAHRLSFAEMVVPHRDPTNDWPVMPVDAVSFRLKPVGFFDRNPALDLAPADGSCHGPASSGPPDQPM